MAQTDGRLARGEASRAAMLAAATEIVATEGIQGLTHRAVAARIAVPHATVVYHFPLVSELRQATLLQAGSKVVGCLAELIEETPDPARVPQIAADLAVLMVTTLRNETVTLYELLAQATRDDQLRPAVELVNGRIADLIEPLSGSRALASTAAASLLGLVLLAMAAGADQDQEALRRQVAALIEHFDPRLRPPWTKEWQ